MSAHDSSRGSAGSRIGAGASRAVVLACAFGTALVVMVADQVTKVWALNSLELNLPRPFLGELLQLRLIHNSGAAFGLGSSATAVITAIQIAISVGIVVGLVSVVRERWWSLSLGLMLGGALGNVIDRLFRAPGPFRGHVIDFLELPHWPIFNVADIAVTTGACLLILLTFLNVPTRPELREEGAR